MLAVLFRSDEGAKLKRRKLITLIGGLAIAWSLTCYAQLPQSAPPKRVGILALYECPGTERWLSDRLAEFGWRNGAVVFDCDQIPALARELVSRRPDVLVTGPSIFVLPLKQETTTIPIVMGGAWEPIRQGIVTSLARPGGNVTGVAYFGLFSKQMELLREIVPRLRRVAVIQSMNPPSRPLK
jgi:putative ABC transport system substrate-binding protein